MWSDLPWPAITAASGGWLLVFIAVYMLFTGRIATAREMDEKNRVIKARDELIAQLTAQNTLLLESSVPTVNSVLRALAEAAEAAGDES